MKLKLYFLIFVGLEYGLCEFSTYKLLSII